MFHSSQKSFEKSLRSSAITAAASTTTYQVPIITPLKTEIHKGCTGKAHACGTIKNVNTILVNKSASPSSSSSSTTAAAKVKVAVKCENKPIRKNSLSSETVSDSGSESWNSNGKDSSSGHNMPSTPLPKPLKRTKSVNYGSTAATNGNARRRTSDSIINTDVTDNCQKSNNVKLQRGRLSSDGDGKQTPTANEATNDRLRRSSSFRSKNIPPLIPPKPKPVATSSSVIKPNGSFNSIGRLRSSFRGLKNQAAVNWNVIYESSFSTKFGGGNFRILDKNLLASKVI